MKILEWLQLYDHHTHTILDNLKLKTCFKLLKDKLPYVLPLAALKFLHSVSSILWSEYNPQFLIEACTLDVEPFYLKLIHIIF